MGNPQDKTIETYQQHFDRYVERTPAQPSGEFRVWMDSFTSHIPKGGLILEIGSASGRDARYFRERGFEIICTDIVPQALKKLSEEGFDTLEFDFRNKPNLEWAGKFDGFFANAVFLHASPDILQNTLRNLAVILKGNGVAAFSLKTGEGEEITLEKMDAPRYFHYYSEYQIREILKLLPFEVVSLTYADQEKWIHVVMKGRKVEG